MTQAERNAARALASARATLSLDRDTHVPALVKAGRLALAAGDGLQAWLLADRLCRITGEREALPFLLRAGALAILGDAKAAQKDLALAAELNPDHPLVLEALLVSAEPNLQLAAAKRAAGHPDAPASVYRRLAAAGLTHLVRLSNSGNGLRVQAIWSGEAAFPLTLTAGSVSQHETIHAQGAGPEGYAHIAELDLPWPGSGQTLIAQARTIPPINLLCTPSILIKSSDAPPENRRGPGPPGILVVVPVYGDADATREALDALFMAMEDAPPTSIVVIDDASPEPALTAHVSALAAAGRITLLRNPDNLGFSASVNAGLALRKAGEDVLVLNADAFLPARALARLRAVAHSHPTIGTVTPFSNNGEDTSIPIRLQVNDLPGPVEREFIDGLAEMANGLSAVEIPNGVGFCLYIRGDVLDAVGGFSAHFERGYYEDVDFCLRAGQAGFQNVCATGIYVAHAGSRSFGTTKRGLVRRNLVRLTARYPDYRARNQQFVLEDPLIPALTRIEGAFLGAIQPPRLVAAPADTPPQVLKQIFANLSADRLETLVLAVRQSDMGLECRLRGMGGAFPVGLTFIVSAGTDPGTVLAARLPKGVGELLLLDPVRLPADLGRALVGTTPRLAIAVSDLAALKETPPAWLPPVSAVTLATPALGVFARQAFPGSALQVLKSLPWPSEPTAPWAQMQRLVAILPQNLDSGELVLARMIADCLARADCGAVLIGEGELEDMAGSPLWVTGAIPREELAQWLRCLGITACVLPSRRYAASDPAAGALAAQGFALAGWSPAFASRPHLDLPLEMPDAAAAEAVAAWFHILGSTKAKGVR